MTTRHEPLKEARALQKGGRFKDALTVIDLNRAATGTSVEADVMRMELLERTGEYTQSERLARRLIESRALVPSHRSACETSLGLIGWDSGRTTEAFQHFQKAIEYADQCGEMTRLCWAQLRLAIAVAGAAGPSAAERLLGSARRNTMKLGDPHLSAAFHIFLGELEAKRGHVSASIEQSRLGQRLLRRSSNVWLEAMAENNLAATSIMMADSSRGLEHAARARELAIESGAVAMLRAALGNLANLHCLSGNPTDAISLFERANALLPSCGEHHNAGLDGLARAFLRQGNCVEAERILATIEGAITEGQSELLYANRYASLTKTELLVATGRWSEAADSVEATLRLAAKANDEFLKCNALSLKAEILGTRGDLEGAHHCLFALASELNRRPADVHAGYERAYRRLAEVEGSLQLADLHAERVYRVTSAESARDGQSLAPIPDKRDRVDWSSWAIEEMAALFLHTDRPKVLSASIVQVLRTLDLARGAECLERQGEEVTTFAAWGIAPHDQRAFEIPVGADRGCDYSVMLSAPDGVGKRAALNSLRVLIQAASELREHRKAQAGRLTLGPGSHSASDDDDGVINGEAARLMELARKLAQTNVSVLIIGESGTGKELLARAIHRYSPRAKKPFVPFNCTAVPRDLIESHVFGYRRGAFTGADRDHPGLIRSACDGTLFLDEIGELGLDVQPKLLRFLESREVSPLGEARPSTVDVRIVAATNANLDRMVKDGRFREDLYYRLNVVRLEVPPLRDRRDEIPALVHFLTSRACEEFGKGEVRVGAEVMEHLLLYQWPGNIRQLQNELRRMVALADPDTELTPDALSETILRQTTERVRPLGTSEIAVSLSGKLPAAVAAVERAMIKAALDANDGLVEAAARALGISRKGLYLKRQRLAI